MRAMRITTWIRTGATTLALCIFLSCATPNRSGEPLVHFFAAVDKAQCDHLWEVSQDVLRENRFLLDDVDRRQGRILTRPETSQQFFEFWRHDVDTSSDACEASLRTVRRRAAVNIDFDKETGDAHLTITVQRERFATPERQFNNSITAFRAFGTKLPGVRTGRSITAADTYWINDGRDLAMEQHLLEMIVARANGP